jgi:hypothetical protein
MAFEKCTGQKLSPSKCSLLIREGADTLITNKV